MSIIRKITSKYVVVAGEKRVLEPTPDNIKSAKKFLLDKWWERSTERGESNPADLTNACIFAAMFAVKLFGGKMRGNSDHVYAVVGDTRIDLTEGSKMFDDFATKDVDPYKQDSDFMGLDRGFKEQMAHNRPRVTRWLKEFWDLHPTK